ncbi:MAG: hypothetical protein JRM72_08085 [Nitrososphaerota archaeon]|nr:hypothetical protein [Nitrososphaerota archaeon]
MEAQTLRWYMYLARRPSLTPRAFRWLTNSSMFSLSSSAMSALLSRS